MSTVEESPAQRAARQRRERREAKIKEGGAARLDKITSLSGRTPAAERQDQDASPSPSPQPPASISSGVDTQSPASPSSAAAANNQPEPPIAPTHPFPDTQTQSPESLQAQQEAFRALLRQSGPPPGSGNQGGAGGMGDLTNSLGLDEEDPTVKLLNSLMGGMAAGEGGPSAGAGAGNGNGNNNGPAISQADLATALGLPPFVASMLPGGSTPQTESEKKAIWTWKILHVVFAIAVGVYFLVLLGSSVSLYGEAPPPPATARSPFLFFTTGEMVMTGARVLMRRGSGQAGLGMYFHLFRDVIRDGSLVVFLLGMGAWWNGEWTA
ncbi:uncharacterized protein KD926_007529 [Aspergillus affinis]|uniref:uncharacterized protein n=1 Tax=Aspergillus affinis TaxID=1070780 RepID=UPI0022FDEAE7|nr:uncharacterized protein KD926_007529 [Aspergillus affinis]KAI9040987.1 hypothetical protein KD926_007529 [Aspergillus affinis]